MTMYKRIFKHVGYLLLFRERSSEGHIQTFISLPLELQYVFPLKEILYTHTLLFNTNQTLNSL